MARRKSDTRSPGVVFTKQAADRIASAVRTVERGGGQTGAGHWGYRGDDSDSLKLSKTTAAWSKNSTASLTEYTGTAGSETAVTGGTPITAYNKFANVGPDKWVIIGYIDGDWYLVGAEPTQVTVITSATLTGTSLTFATAQVQVFGPGSGNSSIVIPTENC
jgi:hypothetical protein